MPPKDDLETKALTILTRQKEALQALNTDLSIQLPRWRDRTIRMLRELVVRDELVHLNKINTETWIQDKEALLAFLGEIETGIRESPEYYLQPDPLVVPLTPVSVPTRPGSVKAPLSNNVFIVHGHDSMAKLELARTLEKLKMNAIVLHEQPNEGKTIIEKFERDASKVSFAVILLTPDDIGYPAGKPDEAKPRARQNVVLELGFFSGALSRSNVCVLYKGDVEIPSDYLGVVYINMDDGGAWRFALAKELRQAGLPVDLNNLV